MKNCIEIIDKKKCTGCTACVAVCPKGCIAIKDDAEGFGYPEVDLNMCVSCGKCKEVCFFTNSSFLEKDKTIPVAFVGTNRDENIRAQSTSGGMFGALAAHFLSQDGLVCGASFDRDWTVVHNISSDGVSVKDMYGSKYVQSDLVRNEVFKRVLDASKQGQSILFCGTPCQAYGLRALFKAKKQNDNLLLVCSFICRSVASPLVWEAYLEDMSEKYGANPKNIVFRNKTYGYHSGTMKIAFNNGKTYLGSGRVDPMYLAFFSNLVSRPSCYSCPFRNNRRVEDITFFDCWSYKQNTHLVDDNLGHTNIWVHTTKGLECLNKINDLVDLVKVQYSDTTLNDAHMAFHDIERNPQREAFFRCFNEASYSEISKKFMHVTWIDRLLDTSKKTLNKLHLLQPIAKLKRSIELIEARKKTR